MPVVYIAVIIITAILTVKYEIPRLKKQKLAKDLWLFIIMLTCSVALSIAEGLDLPIPNPLDFLTFMYKPISQLVLAILE